MERLIERQRRRNRQLQTAQQQAAVRGEQRHHEIDQRFDTIETNTAHIAELARRLGELETVVAQHRNDPAGKAHR